ncbi:LytR/AlgR family response regulator transcription factor [Lachnobacterium bovis]|uniref:Stage 0 sporulation protein A homolog n=1 Tax=Lachnobacterium bovis TaxID=140626 RepID=A0A1H9P8A7_9FIRM|nr:LytTR family DNA-binding domain-containing protein [Lachnobacterium bovis]SER44430.1 two component transcriptional regulator, LytTR family [Lachnobacterium bovis]
MYKIAVCDDEEQSIKEAITLLSEYKEDNPNMDWEIDTFSASLELLDAMDKKVYDIYILDIYIDEINGIELAKMIRKKDEKGAIIFETSSDGFYKEAFRLKAIHYLEKPLLKEELYDALDRIFESDELHYLVIKESGVLVKIPVDDIMYITSEDHYKRIFEKNGEHLIRITMQALTDNIKEDFFYMPNGKMIINLKYILKISKKEIVMEDGKVFPMPRGAYRTVGELFVKYSM